MKHVVKISVGILDAFFLFASFWLIREYCSKSASGFIPISFAVEFTNGLLVSILTAGLLISLVILINYHVFLSGGTKAHSNVIVGLLNLTVLIVIWYQFYDGGPFEYITFSKLDFHDIICFILPVALSIFLALSLDYLLFIRKLITNLNTVMLLIVILCLILLCYSFSTIISIGFVNREVFYSQVLHSTFIIAENRRVDNDWEGASGWYNSYLAVEGNRKSLFWDNRTEYIQSVLEECIGSLNVEKRKGRYDRFKYIYIIHNEDIDDALAELSEAIRLNLNDADAYHCRGLVKARMKDFDGAVDDFANAIRIEPSQRWNYYELGRVKQLKGDIDGALVELSKAVQQEPKEGEIYLKRGMLYFDKGNYSSALADFMDAVLTATF